MKSVTRLIIIILALGCCPRVQALTPIALSDSLNAYALRYAHIGEIRVSSIQQRGKRIQVYTNQNLSGLSLSPQQLKELKQQVGIWLQGNKDANVTIYSDGQNLDNLISARYQSRPLYQRHRLQKVVPLVSNQSRPYSAPQGLDGKHIALWGSHGLYYKQDEERWRWQRARLWTTVEDLYTTVYTYTYLVPMLENAGAIVIQPRERDIQTEEVIVDDTEAVGDSSIWSRSDGNGWGRKDGPLTEGDNPFRMGHYIVASCRNEGEELCYRPHVTKEGEYAVYVSYATHKNSTDKAHYRIRHMGQVTDIVVNQQMGGGTWVYVGTYAFSTLSEENSITLVVEGEKGQVVTADAIRLGGGMGSVARRKWNDETEGETSGYPRFMEGARYYMQYSGIPDSIYNFTEGKNDYTDDFASRGRWVNYLTGGSEANPKDKGLGIPLNMSMALHSDAGATIDNEMIGTLTIYTEKDNDGHNFFPTGATRQCNRDLADMMQTQLVEDIRATICPEWPRRSLKNANYSESRNPKVPCALIELLSHQNFADMRWGLDPKFQFVASRAIYKGILRFLHEQTGAPYVVQPLPPTAFAIEALDDSVRLRWKERIDPLEETAHPTYYIVYTREDGSDWDNGQRVETNEMVLPTKDGVHYDYVVVAGNDGGISMRSEMLSACLQGEEAPLAIIVNAFTRLAAPDMAAFDSLTGGIVPHSYAVPYGNDIGFIGEQCDYDRMHAWKDDDESGFGMCYTDYAKVVTKGNTFDYPRMHGKVLQQMGWSYVSSSVEAVDSLEQYALVDIILGKERNEKTGCIPPFVRPQLQAYMNKQGRLIMSGAYIGSNMLDKASKRFVEQTLHYTPHCSRATHNGRIAVRGTYLPQATYQLRTTPNEEVIPCCNPDGIEPTRGAIRLARYEDSGVTAGIALPKRLIIWPFMMESIERFEQLYHDCIQYLSQP